MSKHANRPALPEDLRGADDVVSIREAYTRGYTDGQRHVRAEVARALLESGTDDLPDDAVATLREWAGQAAPASSYERDMQIGDERRGEQ